MASYTDTQENFSGSTQIGSATTTESPNGVQQIVISGQGTAAGLNDTIDNAAVALAANASANLTGSGATLTIGTDASANVIGSGNAITGGTLGFVGVFGDNNTLTATGGGASFTGIGESGNLSNTTIYLGANTQANIAGSNDAVAAGSNDTTGVFGNNDTYTGTGGVMSFTGSGDFGAESNTTIYLGANTQANVNGSGNNASLQAGDSFGIGGGGNTVNSGPGDLVYVTGTNGNLDTLYANGDQSGSTTASGQGTGLYLDNNAQANVVGSSNTVGLGTGDSFGAFGGSNVLNAGPGDTLILGSTGGNSDTVYASGDQAIHLDAGTQANVIGNSNSIGLDANATLGASGSSNTIYAEPGDTLGIGSTGGNADTVYANGDQAIHLDAGTQANVIGNSNSIGLDANATLGASGSSNTIYAGPGDTLGIGSTGGNADTVYANGDQAIHLDAGTQANVIGNSNSIGLDANATLGASGSSNTIYAEPGDTLGIGSTGGNADTVYANGDQAIHLDAGTQANVIGNSNSIGLDANATLGASGSSNTIYAGPGDTLGIGSTGGNADTVYANGDQAIHLDAGTQANVIGNSNSIGLDANATLGASGGSNTIYAGPGDSIGLGSTGANSDTVYASGDQAIHLDAGTQANVIGNSNAIGLDANATLGASGGSDTIYAGPGDSIGLDGTGEAVYGNSVTVATTPNSSLNLAGSNDAANLGTGSYIGILGGTGEAVSGNGIVIGSTPGSSLNLTGNSDVANLAGGSYIGILGGINEAVNGSGITVGSTPGASFNLAGGNDTANLAGGSYVGLLGGAGYTVNGSGITVATAPDTSFNLVGNNDFATLNGTGNSAGIFGGANTVNAGGDNNIVLGSTGAATDVANISGDASGGVTANGQGTGISLGTDTRVNVTGGGDTINGNQGDKITASNDTINLGSNVTNEGVFGSYDQLFGNSDKFSVTGNYDPIHGSSDTEAIYGTNDVTYGSSDNINANSSTDTASGSGDSDNEDGGGGGGGGGGGDSGSTGAAAGITRTMNVIAQYDLGHGYTAAAAAADVSWNRTEQAISAAADSAVAPPSPFNGIRWTGPVVTWSFATGPGTATAPFSGSVEPQYQAVIEQAIQTWATASGLKLVQVADSSATNVRIGWGNFDTASSGTVGYTNWDGGNTGPNQSVIVRLENPAEDPLAAGANGALGYSGTGTQLYQVALHEIGHALGLAESSDPNSVLFPELGPANTKLDATDVNDISAIYNPGAVSGDHAAALLAQAMASFGVSSPSTTSMLPPHMMPEPALAANALH